MPVTPTETTARWWVAYEGPAGRHELMFRFPVGTGSDDGVTAARAIVTAMRVFLSTDVVFNGCRHAGVGVHLSFPITWGAPIAGTGAPVTNRALDPQFISFGGRGLDGKRVRWTLHGTHQAPDADYRILSGDVAAVAAVYTALDGATPRPVTVTGSTIVLYAYADTGLNAHFQRAARRRA